MKVQLFTLNEITDAMRQLSKEEDSITALLGSGQFRTKFETCVYESRSQRDASSIETLTERLVPITHNGQDVYILDDIQGALNKKQFAAFMTFIKRQQLAIGGDETTYVPVGLVELFIQSQQEPTPAEETLEPDDLAEPDEVEILRFR